MSCSFRRSEQESRQQRPPRLPESGPYSAPGQRWLDQAIAGCSGRRGSARRLVQLPQDVRNVPMDGVLADNELRGDLAVASSGGDEREHLVLAAGERALGRASQQPVDSSDGAASVERDEGVACRRRLGSSALLLLQLEQGTSERELRPRTLVGRVA